MENFELLTSNLAVIDRAIAFAARRLHLDPDDAEDFASIVKLKLVENDCAILRAYEARSSFATFISIVVQRMALDYRIHEWGKWHPSAEAKRLGPLALELEQLVRRDGRTLDDALVILAARHDGLTREALAALEERLPQRAPQRREVALEEAGSLPAKTADVEENVLAGERRETSARLSSAMSAIVGALPADDRLLLQLRFEGGMTVAEIARAMQIEQKLLYRRLDKRLREIRAQLERAGFAPRDVLELIGRDDAVVAFDFGKQNSRPSISGDENPTARSEAPQ